MKAPAVIAAYMPTPPIRYGRAAEAPENAYTAFAVPPIIWLWPAPPRWLSIASLIFPGYYTVLSLVLNSRRSTR